MSNKQSNRLSNEEQDILDSYENDEWISVSSPSGLKKYQAAAKNTFKKTLIECMFGNSSTYSAITILEG